MKLYVLYENPDWMPPLRRALTAAQVPFAEWFVEAGHIDLAKEPPRGVFLNRVSPSSHTRGHLGSIALARQMIDWLEAHGRRVINGSRAFALETSKVRQYAALRAHGIATPQTVAVTGGPDELLAAAQHLAPPFITKHNCGGKGLGVQLFRSTAAFEQHITAGQFVPSPDQVTLLQEYVAPRDGHVTRVEIVDGQALYAIHISTERGFQLCPAEACDVGDAFCPTTDVANADPAYDRQSLFSLREGFAHPIVDQYVAFTQANGIDIAGIEFIEDEAGRLMTYDVNTTTNYSPGVESAHQLDGMGAIAALALRLLRQAT